MTEKYIRTDLSHLLQDDSSSLACSTLIISHYFVDQLCMLFGV